MQISPSLKRIIKIIAIVLVILIIVIIVTSEIDRRRYRKVECPIDMYYEGGHWITAPFNILTSLAVKRPSDLDPFPSLKDNFPDHERLRKAWRTIRSEVLDLYHREGMSKIKDDLFFQKIADDGWKKFYIKWYGPSLQDAREKLPFTTKLVDSFPEIRSAMISVLEPGSRITPHIGPYRGVLRYHLGLVTPNDADNCSIILDGEKYSWHEGEDVLFDDTYVHEVHNNTSDLRIVLFCDVQRDLNNPVSNLIGEFSSKVAKVTTRNNK